MKNLCDLHTHSVLSNHAYSSLTENIAQAKAIGLEYYGISEHQPDCFRAGANIFAIAALEHVPSVVDGVRVLKGCEFNVLEYGELDTSFLGISQLDYGIASFHRYAYQAQNDINSITDAWMNVLDFDFIRILGHCNDSYYNFDIEKVIRKCKTANKVVEVNNAKLNNAMNIANMKKILACCQNYEVPVIANSDAHIRYEIGQVGKAFQLLEEVNFPIELILNYNQQLIEKYLIRQK